MKTKKTITRIIWLKKCMFCLIFLVGHIVLVTELMARLGILFNVTSCSLEGMYRRFGRYHCCGYWGAVMTVVVDAFL